MKLAIYVMHVPGVPSRVDTLAKLRERVPSVVVVEDPTREGAWATARRCWEAGLADDEADWIIVLNDDALPCDQFQTAAENALATRDPRDPVCFYTAHPKAKDVASDWYTTHDDLVGVGCALSRWAAEEFLDWVDANPAVDGFSDDGRINLWAMATGRLIYTTVPSLVDHQLPDESTVPWTGPGAARTAVVPPMTAFECGTDPWEWTWNRAPKHLGRARTGNQWEMLFRLATVKAEHIERAYLVQRHGEPVSDKPHVFIAMPAARAPELAVRVSVQNVVQDLQAHGVLVSMFESPGDSLVTRGRHALCNEFLSSSATHLLQWDDDVECLDATAVRHMVESCNHIVGGAYPWRDGSGRVVANLLRDDVIQRHVDVNTQTKCIKVAEVGTGFLLVSRACLVDLCALHPELMYMSDYEPYVGCPMWALFDAHLEMRADTGRRRYASEDWRFCSLAREAGYDVHVYYPPIFRHWGKHAHQGHVLNAWGMNKPQAEAAE